MLPATAPDANLEQLPVAKVARLEPPVLIVRSRTRSEPRISRCPREAALGAWPRRSRGVVVVGAAIDVTEELGVLKAEAEIDLEAEAREVSDARRPEEGPAASGGTGKAALDAPAEGVNA